MTKSFGGFVLEMGDAEQHGSFETFARHIKANQLTATWQEERRLLGVAYKSGNDVMEAGFTTDFGQPTEVHYVITPDQQEKAIPWRRLNGQTGETMARNFLVSGLAQAPRVTVNGRPVDAARVGADFQFALASL
jgi:hypothetical protein